jgi:ABC-type lipoprotein release transport system permease subunit
MPSVAAAALGVAAMGTLAHALLLAVRRRRRDFAVLKTLGFVGRDVAAAVAWQASVVVALALALGLPLGIAAGRTMWAVFADRIGVQPVPVVPVVGLMIVIPVALVLANAVAAFPGRAAARTGVAQVLRGD